jgi:hypothetical protein
VLGAAAAAGSSFTSAERRGARRYPSAVKAKTTLTIAGNPLAFRRSLDLSLPTSSHARGRGDQILGVTIASGRRRVYSILPEIPARHVRRRRLAQMIIDAEGELMRQGHARTVALMRKAIGAGWRPGKPKARAKPKPQILHGG